MESSRAYARLSILLDMDLSADSGVDVFGEGLGKSIMSVIVNCTYIRSLADEMLSGGRE